VFFFLLLLLSSISRLFSGRQTEGKVRDSGVTSSPKKNPTTPFFQQKQAKGDKNKKRKRKRLLES
jgi:hypothetical protein